MNDSQLSPCVGQDPTAEIVPGVRWGEPYALFTPAYWYSQYFLRRSSSLATRHRIGETFAEEVASCLLGGHGIPAETGLAAFRRLKERGLIQALCCDTGELENALYEPLRVNERYVRYRFWKQKAVYIGEAFRWLKSADINFEDPVELRNTLMGLPGIGPKTASWIVRNWLGSDLVAILDIHIVRAGILMRLYAKDDRLPDDYTAMEEKFVTLARNMGIPTSDLDALIWSMMRSTPTLISRLMEPSLPYEPPSTASPVAKAENGICGTNRSAAPTPVRPNILKFS